MMKLLKRNKGTRSSSNSNSNSSSVSSNINLNISINQQDSPLAFVVTDSASWSLGTGHFSPQGSVESFVPSPRKTPTGSSSSRSKSNIVWIKKNLFQEDNDDDNDDDNDVPLTVTDSSQSHSTEPEQQHQHQQQLVEEQEPIVFLRHASSFLRVADLQMEDDDFDTSLHSASSALIPNYHHSSSDPPPGMEEDPIERWVCLDIGCDSISDNYRGTCTGTNTSTSRRHAPIAPAAVQALARTGLTTVLDTTMWVADSKTAKIMAAKSKLPSASWETSTFTEGFCPSIPPPPSVEDHVLVWSGKFRHGLYGSDLPAVRAAAIIQMSPEKLLNLLSDSSRVKEYNLMSLGRTDLLVFENCGGHGGIMTKVMRSESSPPMLRKTLQFTSIFHTRTLAKDEGYLLVSRAVDNAAGGASPPSASVLVSEILMGVNVIRRVQGSPDQCLFVTVNHIRSPMVPQIIARRIGLQAAVNFINDLRRCC